MEPNVDRGMWSVVALLAAIVIGGVVLLAFPKISGKIANNMDDTVNKAFSGEKADWVPEQTPAQKEHYDFLKNEVKENPNLLTNELIEQRYGTEVSGNLTEGYVVKAVPKYSGLAFKMPLLNDGEDYILTYKYKQIGGNKLKAFGGHVNDAVHTTGSVFVNGVHNSNNYYHMESSIRSDFEEGKEYEVVAQLRKNNNKGLKYADIYIQPDRGVESNAVVEIWDVKLVKVKTSGVVK